ADAPVGTEIHQALDVHRHFTAKIALDRELGDLRAQGFDLGFGEVLDLGFRLDASRGADFCGASAADTVNRGQRDDGMLVNRNIDASYTGHLLPSPLHGSRAETRQFIRSPCKNQTRISALTQSTLALLVPRIGADHAHDAIPANDLAVAAHFLDRSSDFHRSFLKIPASAEPFSIPTPRAPRIPSACPSGSGRRGHIPSGSPSSAGLRTDGTSDVPAAAPSGP